MDSTSKQLSLKKGRGGRVPVFYYVPTWQHNRLGVPPVTSFAFSMVDEVGFGVLFACGDGKGKKRGGGGNVVVDMGAASEAFMDILKTLLPGHRVSTASELPEGVGFYLTSGRNCTWRPCTLSMDVAPLLQELMERRLLLRRRQQRRQQQHSSRPLPPVDDPGEGGSGVSSPHSLCSSSSRGEVVVPKILMVNFFHTLWSMHNIRKRDGYMLCNQLSSPASFCRTPGYLDFVPLRDSEEERADLRFSRVPFPTLAHPKADALAKLPEMFREYDTDILTGVHQGAVKVRNPYNGQLGYLCKLSTPASRVFISEDVLSTSRKVDYLGVVYHVGRISNRASELDLLYSECGAFGWSNVMAMHLGVVGSGDEPFELQEYLESHMLAQRCSGIPTLLGFVRVLDKNALPPGTSIPRPYSFTGAACASTGAPKFCADPFGPPASVFMLGEFFQHPVRGGEGSASYASHDSGRKLTAILTAVQTFVNMAGGRALLSTCQSRLEGTMRAKITAACGVMGLKSYVSLLPEEVASELEVLIPGNSSMNRSVLLSKFLNVEAQVVLLAVVNTPRNLRIMEGVFRTFGCPFSLLGHLCKTKKIMFFDDRGPECSHGGPRFMSFKMHKPRYGLPINRWCGSAAYRPTAPSKVPYTSEANGSPSSARDILLSILRHPTVACKNYIVKHVDRCASGRVAQQCGVGPLDLPVADYSILVNDPFTGANASAVPWGWDTPQAPETCYLTREDGVSGVCSALGEKDSVFPFYPEAGAKMAIAESVLSLALSPVYKMEDVTVNLSLTWPHFKGSQGEIFTLLNKCKRFCSDAGVSCNVTSCTSSQRAGDGDPPEGGTNLKSFVASAFAYTPCATWRLSPDLKQARCVLLFLPASPGKHVFASVYQQVMGQKKYTGPPVPISGKYLGKLARVILRLRCRRLLISGHDVGDGGLWAALAEMAMSGLRSLNIEVPAREADAMSFLVSETPGVVVECAPSGAAEVAEYLRSEYILFYKVGTTGAKTCERTLQITKGEQQVLFECNQEEMEEAWKAHSARMERYGPCFGRCGYEEKSYEEEKEAFLTYNPFRILATPNRNHRVAVLLLPGCPYPVAALNALRDSGFDPLAVSHHDLTSVLTDEVRGLFVAGTCNTSDTKTSDTLTSELVHAKNPGVLKDFMARKNTFSLGVGSMACRILFDGEMAVSPALQSRDIKCAPAVSCKFESRWLNVFINNSTRAVAFKTLRGSLLPCWVQGTHLGFEAVPSEALDRLVASGQAASMFYGSDVSSGPAKTYPTNPTETLPVAGICSQDGRHLALLHDITASYYLWQWPHVPKSNVPISVSPWKQVFYDLHAWVIAHP
ncbi:tegument protein [Equid gammaherpesvirus 5]|uniref:Protein G3 n=1 Tax=Equid gammaherpesvirus 5 TaxID=10371 RepID=A0A0B4Q6P6_9GAMA|nr:protein G3 [Equid gammaherpesvirus 5]AIU39531.1 protein G3 [Equid gammaherpesvirus 5]APT43363.1 tegument protein [Equid gammaherpesvirus 5]